MTMIRTAGFADDAKLGKMLTRKGHLKSIFFSLTKRIPAIISEALTSKWQCCCTGNFFETPKWILLFSSHVDINECVISNGGCSETCFNTLGGYMCGCREGFTPDADNKTCVSKYRIKACV